MMGLLALRSVRCVGFDDIYIDINIVDVNGMMAQDKEAAP